VAEHTDGDMGNFEVYLADFEPGRAERYLICDPKFLG
jgi:hypothetical protein